MLNAYNASRLTWADDETDNAPRLSVNVLSVDGFSPRRPSPRLSRLSVNVRRGLGDADAQAVPGPPPGPPPRVKTPPPPPDATIPGSGSTGEATIVNPMLGMIPPSAASDQKERGGGASESTAGDAPATIVNPMLSMTPPSPARDQKERNNRTGANALALAKRMKSARTGSITSKIDENEDTL